MKRDYSVNSLIQTDPISSFISPKNSRSNLFKVSRPQSSRLGKIKTYSSSTTDITLPAFSSKNSHVKSFLEPELLIQEKFQLRNVVRNLRKELFILNQENLKKKNELKEKDKIISNIIDNENLENDEQENILMNKIRKHIKQVKLEINEIEEKNEFLKKDSKLTKVNEYIIENEKMEEQINKINALIKNGKEIGLNVNEKINELSNLKLNVNNQFIILNQMNNNYNNLLKEEELLNKQIEIINEKVLKDKKIINENQNKVFSLQKTNQNLQNDKTINNLLTLNNNKNKQFKIENYQSKISEMKKLLNHYKIQLKFTENSLSNLKNENSKLKDISITKRKEIKNEIIINNSKNKSYLDKKKTDEEIIKKLKETLQNSKEIEIELEKQLKIYKDKLQELDDKQINEQIEFGIDADNPFYSPNENNDPIKTLKFTSIQFNQFTYILFKNFEAKNINLENNKSKFIDDLINYSNKEEEYIEEVDINSNNFISIVNKFSESICDVLNCENEYNMKILKIFIGALLFNSGGSIVKLCEYFTVLFSYTKEYQKDIEEKLIERLNRKYKDKADLLLKLINEENTLNEEYISLLDVKDIIDNNNIDLKDKYIEFIFYLMKKFDDKKAKLSDLKISNYANILNNNSQELNLEDKLNKNENENKKKSEDEKEDIKISDDKKNSITDNNKENNNNNSNNNNSNNNYSNNDDESITEITNEEYEKIINSCITSIKKGINDKKTTFSNLFGNYIKSFKSEGNNINVISIEDFNEQLKIINISLSDLQLSCLCSKYSIPENVRLIKPDVIEKDLNDNLTINNDSNINDNNDDNNNNNNNNNNQINDNENKELLEDKLKYDKTDSFIENDFEEIGQKTF